MAVHRPWRFEDLPTAVRHLERSWSGIKQLLWPMYCYMDRNIELLIPSIQILSRYLLIHLPILFTKQNL